MRSALRIAVTGANGFIGRHLLDRAAQRGDDIRPLTRANGPDLATASADAWAGALTGCDTCIHLAGALPGASKDATFGANVTGTAALLGGCAQAGVQHLIFVSSIGVLGYYTTPRRGPMRPDDIPAPHGDYARSKLDAERLLRDRAANLGVALTILRPPLVYGPSNQGSFAALVRLLERLPVLPFGGLDTRRDLVGVRNLADCLLTLAFERCEGLYHVTDRQTVSMTELVRKILQANGWKRRLISLPDPLRRMAMSAPVTNATARRLFGDMEVDDSALVAASSWKPPYSLDEEIAFSAGSGAVETGGRSA